jgi:ATP-binding cassette subfamily B protein
MKKSTPEDKAMGFKAPAGKISLLKDALDGRKAIMTVAFFAVLIGNLLNFIGPQVVRFTVDCVLGDEAPAAWLAPYIDTLRQRVWLSGVILLLVAVAAQFLGFIRRYGSLEPAEYMSKQLRDRLYGHIQRLPFNWHVKAQTGDIIQRSTNDVDVVRNTVANVLPEFTRSVIMIFATIAVMFSMDGSMAVAGMCLMPFFAVSGVIYHRIVGKTFKDCDESEGKLQSTVQENLSGVRVIRAFGRERFEIERFSSRNKEYFGKCLKMGNSLAMFWTLSDFIALAQLITVVTVGTLRCLNGDLTIGTFLAFFTYTNMLLWPARETGRHLSEIAKCSISLGRILEILKEPPEQDAPGALQPDMTADIVFDGVTFAYEKGAPVLNGVSFTLKRGQTLGVLGGTGSGKSTLAYLLTRLYDLPDSGGRITIGGVDIRNVSREHIRRNVAIVLQEPFLYSKTVGDNIRGAASGAGTGLLENAARVAAIHDTIAGFDKGYDTKIGERGVTLSGGQKQRVAIARTLMQNAPVMIFDDSLSAVDTQTDAQIRKALKSHTGRAAVVLISHRISTLMQADQILVLQNGAVEALGSHEELISGDNTYKRVYDLQRAHIGEVADGA